MPGFKFHIVTVVGVFVALALGIVVGTSLSDNIIIESQMSTIELMQNRINSLELDKEDLVNHNKILTDELKLVRAAEDRLFAVAMEHYNDIENITLISYGDSIELLELDLVKNHKLFLQNTILINSQNVEKSEGLKNFLGVEENVELFFCEKLVNYIHHEDDLSIKYLEQLDIINFSGNYDFSNQKFIIYFHGQEEDELLRLISERLHELNQRVYAVSDEESSHMEDLPNSIIQVDNIKKSTGQIELLQLLDEEVRVVSSQTEE